MPMVNPGKVQDSPKKEGQNQEKYSFPDDLASHELPADFFSGPMYEEFLGLLRTMRLENDSTSSASLSE
jgi:hypothetical protein